MHRQATGNDHHPRAGDGARSGEKREDNARSSGRRKRASLQI
jgi:hypothetical protein